MKEAINILNESKKITLVNTLHNNGYCMFIDNEDLHVLRYLSWKCDLELSLIKDILLLQYRK